MLRRPIATTTGCLLACSAVLTHAQGTSYPNRPIRIVVPVAPGGAIDAIARMLAPPFTDGFKQSVVVDNRAGGASNIGTELVAKAPPDGHTLLVTNSTALVNVFLFPKLPFSFQRDIASVSLLATTPLVMIAHPSLPAKTMKELVALARSRPGQIVYGSPGIGSPAHIGVEMINQMTGARMLHVPYKGGGPLLTDLLGGQIMVALSGLLTAPQFEKSGKLRVLGHTGAHRLASLPDMPTIAEAIPGFEIAGFFALFATGGTPADIIARLNAETVRALQLPDTRKRITDSGAQVVASSARELDGFVAKELDKYGKLVRAAHIRAD